MLWIATHAVVLHAEVAVQPETVILVHGIMNKPFVMSRIASVLTKAGYEVHNWGYPSTSKTIEAHAAALHQFITSLGARPKLHVVGFSQGAIILRYTLTHYAIANVGRLVMIAPPNHGCEMAEDFYKYAWFRSLYGDQSIKQLFAKQNAFLSTVGIPATEFGIIAGGRGDGTGYSASIPGDDDGTISVASAQLPGAKDFLLLRHQHTPLVFQSETAQQTLQFIQTGQFRRITP